MINFEFVHYNNFEEEDFIVLNRLLWEKSANILHWSCIKPNRKYQLKDLDFDSIEVNFIIREPKVLCVLAL